MALYGEIYLSASVLLGTLASGSNSRIGFPRLIIDHSNVLRLGHSQEACFWRRASAEYSYMKIDGVERQRDSGQFLAWSIRRAPGEGPLARALTGDDRSRQTSLYSFRTPSANRRKESWKWREEGEKQPFVPFPSGFFGIRAGRRNPILYSAACMTRRARQCRVSGSKRRSKVLNVLLAHNAR